MNCISFIIVLILYRVFILHGEAEICSEDHNIYNKPFSLLNLLPYLLNDKQNIITVFPAILR